MIRGRLHLAACATTAALTLIAAPPAGAAHARGSFALARQAGAFTPAARAQWTLDGTVLPARAEAPLVGLRADPSLQNTDSRYVRATLQSAEQDPVVTDCGDGMGNTTTWRLGGVARAASVFETDVVLNLLTGRGTAEVGVAESPWPGSNGIAFAPGVVHSSFHSTCWGSVNDSTGAVDVIRDGEQTMYSAFVARAATLRWRLRRAAGAWHMGGSRSFRMDGVTHTVTTSLTFAGSPVSLHARCTMPTRRDLAPARSLAAARRIAARAGFPHVLTGARATRAARRGRGYIDEGIGNRNPVPCGYRRLHLFRSLGWPGG
jgi:hypothetical protein